MKSPKHFILLIIAVICVSDQAFSQLKTHNSAFEKNIIMLDLHTSIGLYKDRNFLTTRAPIFIEADYGVGENIGMGIFAGWNQRTFKDAGQPQFDVNFYYYGAQFSLHATPWLAEHTILKFNQQKVDTYLKIWAGQQHSSVINFGNGLSASKTILGGMIGARIYTMYNVGFMVEIGPGQYGLINVGLCGRI